ncbi:MAG: T9SS type A sorting domain-containing protein [Saprospiraceae bacterium]|nr:T9SS type A sorting domain-containing protein [Saprospiraceae bacterium]
MIRLLAFMFCILCCCLTSLAQSVPVYLYFASHNETNDQSFHGLNYNTPTDYALMRAHVRRVCDTLLAHGAPYDMMLESNFILGCLKNENAAVSGNDLIEWVSQQPGFSVQPHNHFKPFGVGANPYNYADLVYLLDSCGVDTAQVMGGFIWRDFTNPVAVSEDWTDWQTPRPGFTFPQVRWRPTLLWGGGSPNHIDDFSAFGVWKPTAATQAGFGQHDSDQMLINFGNGCGDDFVLWDTTNAYQLAYRIMNFADSVQAYFSGDPDAFFNQKVMMNFRHFPAAGYAEKLGLVLRLIQPYIDNGKIRFSGIMETWESWKTLHPDPEQSFVLRCEDGVTVSSVKPLLTTTAVKEVETRTIVWPNPASESICFQPTVKRLSLLDVWGKLVMEVSEETTCVDITGLTPGVYFYRSELGNGKIVVQR